MSNSPRAKDRRSRRSRLTKYQRGIMASQHSGDMVGLKADRIREASPSLEEMARRLGLELPL